MAGILRNIFDTGIHGACFTASFFVWCAHYCFHPASTNLIDELKLENSIPALGGSGGEELLKGKASQAKKGLLKVGFVCQIYLRVDWVT
jgi:hypothetical protein